MSNYQRPWWLWVNKPDRLTTTVDEESTPDGPVYIIRGEPIIQSLAWLVWGPLVSLLVIVSMTGLAIILQIREQTVAIRAIFILSFLGLPALVWIVTVVLVNRASQRHLQKEQQAERQICRIRVVPAQAKLYYQTNSADQETALHFNQIQAVTVTHPIGKAYTGSVCLALETERGKIILLDDLLGTEAQKEDLARELQTVLLL